MKCNTERGEKPYQYISKTTGQHNVISQTLLKSSVSPHPHTLKQQPIVISAAYLPTTRAITHKDSLQLCIQNEGRLWHAAGEPSTTTHLDVFYLQTHLVNLCLGMMNWKTKLSEKKVQSSTPTPHPTGSLSVSAIWSLLVLGKINSQSLKIEDRYIDELAAFFLPPCKIDLKKLICQKERQILSEK